jgi:hypothetical protein
MLIQDEELLAKIFKFSYTESEGFKLYALFRGALNGAGKRGTGWRRLVMDHSITFEEFISGDFFRTRLNGISISDEERRSLWRCICYARAMLQDCWEVFCGTEDIETFLREGRENWARIDSARQVKVGAPENWL